MTVVRELSSLRPDHPRLFLTPGRLEALQKGTLGEPFLEELKEALFRQADTLLEREAVEFRIVGPRMLERCQELLRRVSVLSLAFRISAREQYLGRACKELCAAAEYPHWNVDHFLDTAELCTTFAIGYDWLHADLPEPERQQIRRSLIEKGLGPGAELQRKQAWWVSARNNWNTVCNGGLVIGALAVADEEPKMAAAILGSAVDNLPLALCAFAPDGAWEAGPHYWEYTAWYSALIGDALTTALGTDLGLFGCSGFDRAGLFPLHCAGATGQYFNYADADAETASAANPVLFWLGERFALPHCIAENHRLLRREANVPNPFDLLWYQPAPQTVPAQPTAALFGRSEVFLARAVWDDPASIFLGFKAGSGQRDHAHLDLGSFVMEALAVRWALDLGADDYDLPGYWDSGAQGSRWKYYRLNNWSHNTLVLNGHLQDAMAETMISRNRLSNSSPFAIADLSAAYSRDAQSLHRGVSLLENSGVLIQDEITWRAGSEERTVRWQMMTDAEITLAGAEATLTKCGKCLRARILSPQGARFAVASPQQKAPENPNSGLRQLMMEHSEGGAKTQIVVLLFTQPFEVEVRELESW
jgi:Heparinase II/III-like protein